MKMWSKGEGEPFRDSPHCAGKLHKTEDAPADHAMIKITGEYPPEGSWAYNREVYEIITVLRGLGHVSIRGEGYRTLSEGDVVHIPPNTWFRWGGSNMDISRVCVPPFDSEQYEEMSEKDIAEEDI